MHPRTPWSSPGGAFGVDYALDSSATATNVDGNGVTPTSYRFVFNGTGISDLELMINGTFSNFGWVLHTLSEGMQKTARRWVSRETINEGPAPELEITYTLPPIPPPLLVSVELDDVAQELCVRVNGGRADSARQTRWIGQVRSRSRSRRAERGTSREDWCRNGAHIREYRPERDIRREDWGFSRSEPRKGWIWSSFPPRRAPHQSRHGGKSVPGGEGAGCGGEAKLFAYCSSGSVSAASFGPPRTFSSLLGLTAGQGLGSKTKV